MPIQNNSIKSKYPVFDKSGELYANYITLGCIQNALKILSYIISALNVS